MFNYYLQLAWLSLKRTPVMSLLMLLTLAIGVAAAMTMMTLQHVMSNNPLSGRTDHIYRLQLNSASLDSDIFDSLENGYPKVLSYRTISTLLHAKITTPQAGMFRWSVILNTDDPSQLPSKEVVRVTSHGFFSLFKVPFIHGQVWQPQADSQAQYQVVISQSMNQRLFGGGNNVGKSLYLNNHPYQIVGIVEDFHPQPSVQDLTSGPFDGNVDIYAPLGLNQALIMYPYGQMSCQSNDDRDDSQFTPRQDYDYVLNNRCFWLTYWVELPTAEHKQNFISLLRGYYQQQLKSGFFERPFGYALSTPAQWLKLNKVVSDDTKVITGLAFVFLMICIINTIALLLAKFIKQAPETGIRRALGAHRLAIFSQHLIESALIGILGGLLGIVFSQLGLILVRHLVTPSEAVLIYSDPWTLCLTLLVALLASLLAGAYPAWRISHTRPAYYLKMQ